jgi:hypothetical protein
LHDEDIRITDIGGEPVAECPGEKARDGARALRERAGRFHRSETGMIIIDDLVTRVAFQGEEQFDDVGEVLRELVGSSVAA